MPAGLLETLATHPRHLACINCPINIAHISPQSDDLDASIRTAQEDHFTRLKAWQPQHNLRLDSTNTFFKDASLVVVENDSLRRGVLT